ncbi:MAG: hypothetical protein Q9212_000702 [Teloschistes hypoglaucus]
MVQSSWLIGRYLFSAYITPSSSSWFLPGPQTFVETEWSSPLQLRRRISKLTFSYFLYQKQQQQDSDCKTPRPVPKAGAEVSPAAAPPVYSALPSNQAPPQPLSREECESVDTKYAQQGLSLLQTSLLHLQQSPSFARQLYIHALVYLLQALPVHLSDPETAGLRSAIPRSCLDVVGDTSLRIGGSGAADSQQAIARQDHHRGLETSSHPKLHDHSADPPTSSSSYLHLTFSTLTNATIRSHQYLLPYLLVFGKMLMYYDHEYRIHQRAIGIFLAIARMVWASIVVAVDPAWLSLPHSKPPGGQHPPPTSSPQVVQPDAHPSAVAAAACEGATIVTPFPCATVDEAEEGQSKPVGQDGPADRYCVVTTEAEVGRAGAKRPDEAEAEDVDDVDDEDEDDEEDDEVVGGGEVLVVVEVVEVVIVLWEVGVTEEGPKGSGARAGDEVVVVAEEEGD